MVHTLKSKSIVIISALLAILMLFLFPTSVNGQEFNVLSNLNSNVSEQAGPIVPEGSIGIYLIIILLLLIASASFIIVKIKLKSKKQMMLEELKETLDVMNRAVDKGDDLGAMNWYRTFEEIFEKYKPFIKEEDYNQIYEDALKVYGRIINMHSRA